MADPQDIIPMAATLLRDLAHKPRPQNHFTPDTIPILTILLDRGMVQRILEYPKMPEETIWSITDLGRHWLVRHGITP